MIKQKLGIKDQRKVILYAPTFRDDDINKAKNTSLNYTWIYKNEKKISRKSTFLYYDLILSLVMHYI